VRLNLLRPERPPPPPKVHAFLAVHYDEEFLDEVAALAERLRGDARLSAATWVPAHAVDTTIHFFLDTREAQRVRLTAFVDELAALASELPAPLRVRASRLHGLPTADSAHFLVVDVEDDGPARTLTTLQARVEAEAVALGCKPQERPFATFLKLARVTPAVDVSGLAGAARSLPAARITAISLYASSPVQIGDVHNRYDCLATAELEAT
jgi:2'-5' RNA ligase